MILEVLTCFLKEYYFLNDFFSFLSSFLPFFFSFLPPSLPGLALSFPVHSHSQDPCPLFESLCGKFSQCPRISQWDWALAVQVSIGSSPSWFHFLTFPLGFVEITSQINYLPLNEDSEFSEVCWVFGCPFILNVKQLNQWWYSIHFLGRFLLNQVWIFCSSAVIPLLSVSL